MKVNKPITTYRSISVHDLKAYLSKLAIDYLNSYLEDEHWVEITSLKELDEITSEVEEILEFCTLHRIEVILN